MASTALTWLSVFFGTFVLEDAALATAIVFMTQQKLTFLEAFSACFLGIAIGDLALYFVGLFVRRSTLFSTTKSFQKIKTWIENQKENSILTYSIFICRFIPGTRLPTYLVSGYSGYSFIHFLILTVVSVFIWVFVTLSVGHGLKEFLAEHLILFLLALIVLLSILKSLVVNLSEKWARKAYLHSWRKWTHFEFWPAGLFYIPIVPLYIYLSLRYRSFFLPFYANPGILHAGLVGESKWDFYKYLNDSEHSLKTFFISHQEKNQFEQIQKLIAEQKLNYPFIVKPDEGQRGFAVRLIKNETELSEYLQLTNFAVLAQEHCDWPHEAGIFYVREPVQKKGYIFSITDKEFPFVLGDGLHTLGDLILQDARARIMAQTYFARHRPDLNSVPKKNEKVLLATCGNHCQGAIFKNGAALNSHELLTAIENLAQNVPDFYFGRFDVRYRSKEDLLKGQNFKIIELNGAGSEATHIWDTRTKLTDAYGVLFKQWEILFKIGYQIKKNKMILHPLNFKRFMKDLIGMKQQHRKLRISS